MTTLKTISILSDKVNYRYTDLSDFEIQSNEIEFEYIGKTIIIKFDLLEEGEIDNIKFEFYNHFGRVCESQTGISTLALKKYLIDFMRHAYRNAELEDAEEKLRKEQEDKKDAEDWEFQKYELRIAQ